MKPTNITLLNPNKVAWALMQPVTSTDINEGITNNLHEEGLYSTTIFNRVGSKERDRTESFIDVKIPIFNPTYFKALIQLKGLYSAIIRGSEYALWDDNETDFIKSNMLEGETGYGFFMTHFYKLEPKLNESFKRKQRVDLFNRFKDIALTHRLIVIPAGIRDIQIQPSGGISEPEINELYRKLLFRARGVFVTKGDENNPIYDNVRWGIQSAYLDIDEFIFRMSDGKRGFFQRKVANRGTVGATRNVITARKVSIANADEDDGADVNSTDIGVYQALLAFEYVARYCLLNGWLARVFTVGSPTAKLVNPKTFEYEYVEVDNNIVDKWTSSDGLNKLFNGFNNRLLRNKPIKINGYFLGLIYDDGKKVKMVGDVNELPDGYDKKYLTPMTYMELFYLSTYKEIQSKLVQNTRYPITGVGSIYPAKVIIKPTDNAEKRLILDDDWEVQDVCHQYPIKEDNPSYYDAMSTDSAKDKLLGADKDGDQLNCSAICGDDSIAEANELMDKREYYISGSGGFLYEPTVEPHEFLFRALTSGL